MTKRKIYYAAVCSILFLVLMTPVFAASDSYTAELDIKLFSYGDISAIFFDADAHDNFSEQEQILYNTLSEGFRAQSSIIDVSKAQYSSCDEMSAFIQNMLNTEYEFGNVRKNITAAVNNGIITELSVDYIESDSVQADFAGPEGTVITSVEQGIAHALDCLDSSMSTLEKVLALHDYLVLEVDYDADNYFNGTIPDSSYKIEGVFINRIAVCEGYSLAYSELLKRIGVSSYVVVSESMNHSWNIVNIDGNWYHADVTFDDPMNMNGGFVFHKYFLKSDSEFLALEHYGWASDIPQANESNSFSGYCFRYDNGKAGMMNYHNGLWYYLDNSYFSPYSAKSRLNISKIDGSSFSTYELDDAYCYMFIYDGRLFASTYNYYTNIKNKLNTINELNFNGTVKKAIAAEVDIVNFWHKLDRFAFSYDVNGTQKITYIDIDAPTACYTAVDDFQFIVRNDINEAILIKYAGSAADVEIPNTVDGVPVRKITGDTFFQCSSLINLTIPSNVTVIGDNAFWNCNYLFSVIINGNLEYAGDEAFANCFSLKNVYFYGNAPETLGSKVFYNQMTDSNLDIKIHYLDSKTGWSFPEWNGIPTIKIEIVDFAAVFGHILNDNPFIADFDFSKDSVLNILDLITYVMLYM